jgi:hypothetical protein
LRPTHLGLNPNRRRRRLSLVVLTSGDKQGRNTTTPWRFEIRFLSRTRETKRAKLFTRNEYHAFTLRDLRCFARRERSVVTHHAREKCTPPGFEESGRWKAIGKREKSIVQKKKEKSSTEIRAPLNSGKKAVNDDANISND